MAADVSADRDGGVTWYGVSLAAGGATRGLPFAALLVFAGVVGPDAFAQVSLLAVASAWLTLLASGGLEFTAMFEERRRLAGRTARALLPAWYLALPVSAAAALVFVGFAVLVGFPVAPWLVMVGSAVLVGLGQLPVLGRARIRHDRRALILFVIVPFAAAALARLAALATVSQDPLWAWVVGDAVQAALVVAFAVPRALRGGLRRPTGAMLVAGVASSRRSWPWVATAGLQGALANLDKFLLFPLVPAEAFGVYALSYQLANISNILVSEYNKARLGRVVRRSVSGHLASLRAEFAHYLAVLLLGGAAAVAAAFVLFRSSYPDIGWLTAVLVAALLPVALYVPLENQVGVLDGRTSTLAWASAAGVAAGAVVLLSLVGALGVVAGVLATAAGYVGTTGALWLLHRRAAASRAPSPADARIG